ncbi:MAG: transcription termination/antitermination factor NusG [Bacteroidales bacterium]|nr:transcription termination/antitermination factor NusG [Bacteroidales bacterium]
MEDANIKKPKTKRWYVLRAIGGQEKKVKEYIETQIANYKLEDFVTQVLVPSEKVYQVRNGKKYSTERNFFPGYVLVECLLTQQITGILRNIPGGLGFLGESRNGGDPLPIRESEVNRILGKVDEITQEEEVIESPYTLGENVKVVDGPFKGFIGIIEDINDEKKKLQVMVKIFGRKTPLELGFIQVEKVKE